MTEFEKERLTEEISERLQHGATPDELKTKHKSAEARDLIDAVNAELETAYNNFVEGFRSELYSNR